VKPIRQPEISVDRGRIVADGADRGLFQRNRMLLELVEKALGQLGGIER
jgi:hypothetical protein